MAGLVALAIYANFFTHHFIPDLRWYLAALALGLYARTTVVLRPLDRERTMPLLLSFLLIGFFIWLAENISTFFGIWRYPDQLGAWTTVHVREWRRRPFRQRARRPRVNIRSSALENACFSRGP